MIRLRYRNEKALAVRIIPLFGVLANAVIVRSISPASCTSIARSSTPKDGVTDWIAPHWPVPDGDGGIAQDRNPRDGWRDLLEQFQPFPSSGRIQT